MTQFDTINENRRMQQIYGAVLHYAADTVVEATAFGGPRRRMQSWIYQLDKVPPRLSTPVRTRLLLEGLGPTYVKLGQIVSSQASTLPDEWKVELDRLQSEVPPVPYDVARQVIIDELGAPPEDLYAWFSTEPLAAASLGQVYRATLHDGRDVVVKVQRPALDNQVKADLGVTRVVSTYAERRSSYAREIGLKSMLEEFGSTLLDELDYYGEAYNMQRLAENLADIPGVHIPTIERSLSTRRVLTQEFISGVKISDVEAMKAAGLDLPAVGDSALRAAIKMLLIDGFFHADPHPGNLLVNLETGVVTFLDSGMVGQITLGQRANMAMLLWTFVQGDVPAMGRQLRSLSVPFRDGVDDKAFDKDFERKMARYGRGSGADIKSVMSAGLSVLRDNGYRLDPQLTLALKSMTQASAFFTPLAPDDRLFTEAALEAAMELGEVAVTGDAATEALKREGIRWLGEGAQALPEYLRGLLSWNDQLKRGKLTVYVDTSSLDSQMNQARQLTSMIVVAVLVAGGLIGSALASQVFADAPDERLVAASQIGFFGFLSVAAVLVVVLLTRSIRRR
ncbi:MAG: AarF/UbiB family protein [Jiangellales bacterium]